MKNLILVLNALLLVMSLSIVIMPKVWMVSIVGGADGVTGMSFPLIWTFYVGLVFLTSALSFSWLLRR
jgi:hypothetical protein